MNKIEFLKEENKALNNHKGELIERVWTLESEINRLAVKNGELNIFLQERTADGWGGHVIDVAMAHIQKLELENERLRKALEDDNHA